MDDFDLNNWLGAGRRRTLVMGVVNVTPDSFSDGGSYLDPDMAVAHARQLAADGADLIDIGGESTRPGAGPVPESVQIQRVIPVIAGLRQAGSSQEAAPPVAISIDTTRAAVAAAALDAGATFVNDISAGRDDPAMLPLVASRGCAVVLMHMQGTPQTMQVSPSYNDVVSEVRAFLATRVEAALTAGVEPGRVILDVGIGFGKSLEHNVRLLREHGSFASLGHPMLLGVSRKRFLGTLGGGDRPRDRAYATAAAVAWGVANGADVVRVHDVKEMAVVVRVIEALRG